MTKIDIIKETVRFYSKDANRRGLNHGGSCQYLTEDGKNCAIGRCIKPSKFSKIQNHWGTSQLVASTGSTNIDSLLSKKYHGHSAAFWSDLQDLHDDSINWVNNTISDKGERQVVRLLQTYK